MKKTSIYISIFLIAYLLILPDFIYAQNKGIHEKFLNEYLEKNIYSLQKAPEATLVDLAYYKLNELFFYENAFKYYEDLIGGNYTVHLHDSSFAIIFFKTTKIEKTRNSINHSKAISNDLIKDIINFDVIRSSIGTDVIMKNQEHFVDKQIFNGILESKRSEFLLRGGPTHISLLMKDKLFIDKEILTHYHPNLSGKIMNRTVAHQKFRDIDGNVASLFGSIDAGTIIVYGDERAKIFGMDSKWERITYFDRDQFDPGGGPLHQFAFSHPRCCYTLDHPSDIESGTKTQSGNETKWPLYIADLGNNRICKVYYKTIIYPDGTHRAIDDYSFTVVKDNITSPYGLALHKGNDLNSSSDDRLWVSKGYVNNKALECIDVSNGSTISIITHLDYGRGLEKIEPRRLSVFRSPSGLKNVLGFVDDIKNSVVFIKLEADGSYINNSTNVIGHIPFGSHKVMSLSLNSYNNGIDGATAWIATDGGIGGCYGALNCGYLSTVKINFVGNTPIGLDYLATHYMGVGSDESFVKLNNLHIEDGHVDIFTMEEWNERYGLRRFKPGIDILSEDLNQPFCRYTGSNLKFRLTNPSQVFIKCFYKKGSAPWVQLQLGQYSINNIPYSAAGLKLPSGTNNLRVKAILPLSDNPVPTENIKYEFYFLPQDEADLNSPNKVYREYSQGIDECTGNGGCPYIYVHNGQDFYQDNNILHRSEFPENQGIDVEDKYILQIPPAFDTNNICQLKIKELNEDYSYFDKIKMIAVDHPSGTNLVVTESNNLAIYFPSFVNSPSYADNDGSDVTDELQYDSTFNEDVGGDEDSETKGSYPDEEDSFFSFKQLLSKFYDKVKNTFNDFTRRYFQGIEKRDNLVSDSVAVIFDPYQSDAIPIANTKADAGTVIGISTTDDYSSNPIHFARRQNRYEIAVPVASGVQIDSVAIDWNVDYAMTYLATTSLYYEGFIEQKMELIEALHSKNGTVLSPLDTIDQVYAEMDNSSEILLKFQSPIDSISEGWERDYVFIVNGRYVTGSSQPRLTNLIQESETNLPKVYALHQNYPNPFNPITTIKFDLPRNGNMSLKVYDILGKEVYSLFENKEAGYYTVSFNGSNLASGVYFYRIEAGDFVQTKRMMLIK